jgi:exosortase C (VPDSG-CTERM-specific)
MKKQTVKLCLGVGVLMAVFALPLAQLMRFAVKDELWSHIPLIPVVSLYLLVEKRRELVPAERISLPWVLWWGSAAMVASMLYVSSILSGYPLNGIEALSFSTLAFVLGLMAVAGIGFGPDVLPRIAFPIGFLFWMVPLPQVLLDRIISFLQYGSAEVAAWMFALTGLRHTHEGLLFHLPNITIEVAPECSGIHSTLVLLILCVLAGYLFLREPRHRWMVIAAAFPLGILRNAFRVWFISWLCVRFGPQMVDSPIHHRGGPVFFAISLIFLGFLIFALRRRERRLEKTPPAPPESSVETS